MKWKCQKCGTEHSSNFCPNCGTPLNLSNVYRPVQAQNHSQQTVNQKASNNKTIVIIVLVIALFVFAAMMGILFGEDTEGNAASGDDTTLSSSTEPEYIEITAQELWNAFEDNEVAADKKYKGKYVKVTGIVNDINSEDFLTSSNILLEVDGSLFGCVQCNFNNSEKAKAIANVEKGQQVTIVGTCGGFSSFNIMISGCELK